MSAEGYWSEYLKQQSSNLPSIDPADHLKQVHDYIRHIFQLFLGWFGIFATVNYAAMGWLAGVTAEGKTIAPLFAWLVPLMFISQNVVGLLGTWAMYGELRRQIRHASRIGGYGRLIPRSLQFRVLTLIAIALSLTLLSWLVIALLLSNPGILGVTAKKWLVDLSPSIAAR